MLKIKTILHHSFKKSLFSCSILPFYIPQHFLHFKNFDELFNFINRPIFRHFLNRTLALATLNDSNAVRIRRDTLRKCVEHVSTSDGVAACQLSGSSSPFSESNSQGCVYWRVTTIERFSPVFTLKWTSTFTPKGRKVPD